MLVLLAALAHGASLDLIDVAGPAGTPTATDGAALWWNPAGLALGHGTRVTAEVAPVLAHVELDRDDPYYGGLQEYTFASAVPYVGVATDASVEGLGLGAAIAVPYARGAKAVEVGPGRTALRGGGNQTAFVMLGAAYEVAPHLSVGLTGSAVVSMWTAEVDNPMVPDLHERLGADSPYTEADIEDPAYASIIDYSTLHGLSGAWSAGAAWSPSATVDLGVTVHGPTRVDHSGDLTMHFGCPPQDDAVGRFALESLGLCYADVDARGTLGFDLPARVQAGVAVRPVDTLRLELMGGLVGWSRFTDFDIGFEDIPERNPDLPEATSEGLEQQRQWARDNRDSGWVGLDVQAQVSERALVGGRVTWDRAAVPDSVVSPNNYDADDVLLMLQGGVGLTEHVALRLSWTHHLLATRTVTDSAYYLALEDHAEDRYAYAQMNGTYRGRIDRVGLLLQLDL